MAFKSSSLRICGSLMSGFYRPPAGVLFPFGHIVSDVAPPHVRNLYAVPTIAKFRSDVDYLARHFRPLQIAELEVLPRKRHREQHSECTFIFSFDDGLREVYEVIVPILRDKGLPAIFFLNSATIDNKQLMWRHKVSLVIEQSKCQPGRIPPQVSGRPWASLCAKLNALRFKDLDIIDEVAKFYGLDFNDYLCRAKPYLTADQVLELSRAGFEFGAHSESHPYFDEISIADQERQISTSVHFIRSLGIQCRYFSFPFDDRGVPASTFKFMADLKLNLSFGASEACIDPIPFSFQRFRLDGGNANISLRDILKQLSAKSLVRRLSGTDAIHRN